MKGLKGEGWLGKGGAAQGIREGVRRGVSGSDLPGLGARSSVSLVHASPRRASGGGTLKQPAGRLAVRPRMLSRLECERHVTRRTERRKPAANRQSIKIVVAGRPLDKVFCT